MGWEDRWIHICGDIHLWVELLTTLNPIQYLRSTGIIHVVLIHILFPHCFNALIKLLYGVKFCACILEDSHYYCENICAGEYLDAYPPTGHALVCSLTVWDYTKKTGSRSNSWGKYISGYYCEC
uniref:Uncharacterized protein n=1 Tax=Oncorhynchus mykiss TaxID=8022 RepID=A0A8C7PYM0_ONCMY